MLTDPAGSLPAVNGRRSTIVACKGPAAGTPAAGVPGPAVTDRRSDAADSIDTAPRRQRRRGPDTARACAVPAPGPAAVPAGGLAYVRDQQPPGARHAAGAAARHQRRP